MNINYEFDTISAISTPFGNGGVAVIRISGKKAFEIIDKIFTKKNLTPNMAQCGWIVDGITKIDEVLVLPFKAPKSYTGEDIIEIHCHGGIKNTTNILQLTFKHGARAAEKGEFTKRAFLNGKMDLSKAEAVADLIHAKTSKFAQKTAQNLSGSLSNAISNIRKNIFNLLSTIMAAVDFPEDVAEPDYKYLKNSIEQNIKNIDKILSTAKTSNFMRDGIKIAIVGQPNVGKSSLFNTLLNIQRAIVTDIAGTTRDIIQETLDIEGIPVTIIDTAGIHENNNIDKVESIGIDFSIKSLQDAELTLFLFDITKGIQKEDEKILELLVNKNFIKVATKKDLLNKNIQLDENTICISVKNQENIDLLKKEIAKKVLDNSNLETDFTTNIRQQNCLEHAKKALLSALDATNNYVEQDLISIDIKTALLFLDEISGEVMNDDILNNIFENFCIGK